MLGSAVSAQIAKSNFLCGRDLWGSFWDVYHGPGSTDALSPEGRIMNHGRQNDDKKTIISSFYKALRSFGMAFPMLLGVVLLLGLFRSFVPNRILSAVFTEELLWDTIIGSLMGSISSGNAVTSYIIGGELLKENVSLIAVTAFIVAWVTVGIVQLPAEAAILGKRFACVRNVLVSCQSCKVV